jgi:hypothetical protein
MFRISRIHGTIRKLASGGRRGREAGYVLMVFAAGSVGLLSIMGLALDLFTNSSR